MAQRVSNTTIDHDIIQRWAEERGGKPARAASTAGEGGTGVIRIDFPGVSGEGTLSEISWDEWFKRFDETNLALVYEETTAAGERSSFNKLVLRETAQAREGGERTRRRALPAGGGGGKARTSSGSRKGTTAGGRRQAARMEAARSTRSKKSSSKTATARDNAARGRKASSSTGRARSTAKRASAPRKSSGRGRRSGK